MRFPSPTTHCTRVQEEWRRIKKTYFRKILRCHPDKGGDAAVFRDVQTAFEVLREIFDRSALSGASFAACGAQSTGAAYDDTREGFSSMPTPSWEFYYR